MTQVIALRDPARRHARAAAAAASGSSRRSPRSCARTAASCAPDADVERVLVAGGRADRRPARRRRDDHGRRARSSRASRRQQLYGALLARGRGAARPPGAAAQGFRYGRAGMQIHLALDEPPQWASPEAERLARTAMRARHAGPRRRLARGQRGRARAAAGRGDDRRRPALRRRPEPRARRQVGSSGSSCRSCRGGRRGDALGEIDVGDGTLDGDAARGLRRPHRRAPRHADHEPRARDAQARRALAGRPRGAQLQPRRRRHLLRLLRARPEPAVAADRASCPATRPPLDGLWQIGASTHPGPGPRRRLGLPRRQAAAAAAAAPARRSIAARRAPASCASGCRCEAVAERDLDASTRRSPRTSPPTPRPASTASASGSSSCPRRRRREHAAAARERPRRLPTASRRSRRSCSSRLPGMEGPPDPGRAHRGAVREHGGGSRASSRPRSLCLTGPGRRPRSESEARAIVVDGLREVAAAARAAGVRLGLEPTHRLGVARDVVPVDDRRGDRAARRGRARRRRRDGRHACTSGTRRASTDEIALHAARDHRPARRRQARARARPAACCPARASTRPERARSSCCAHRLRRLRRHRDLLDAGGVLGPAGRARRRRARPPQRDR